MRQTSGNSRNVERRGLRFGAALAALLLVAGCGAEGIPGLSGGASAPSGGAVASSQAIGSGPVKIALLLPLSAANGAAPAQSLRNAAELAISEFGSNQVTVLVKDDRGTPAGASAAAQEAISEGAELILGPVFSASVAAAGPVAKSAGKPMIAFSTDSGVAQPGVYLLSFTPQSDVTRVVSFAGTRGKKKFAMLAPQNAFGEAALPAFQSAVSGISGGEVVTVQRYAPGGLSAAVAGAASALSGADALLIAEDGSAIAAAAPAIKALGGNPQILGTGLMNNAAAIGAPELAGAWFPAPNPAGFAGFASRYEAKFGSQPLRIATLGYDSVLLASVLTQKLGDARFSKAVLESASGFSGRDGVFRFRADGTNNRALAVFQIGGGAANIVSPAPTSFAKTGT
jgi:branched-chain amino acid transport system substrate-binding protein